MKSDLNISTGSAGSADVGTQADGSNAGGSASERLGRPERAGRGFFSKSEILVTSYYDSDRGELIEPIDVGSYPDGMPLVSRRAMSTLNRLLLRPASLQSFMAAMFWSDVAETRGMFMPHLVLPFFPGARQDRLNSVGDALFTARSIAKLVNARSFPSVTMVDPHSDVAPALVDRCRVVKPEDFLAIPRGKYSAVVSPDAGAEKRAGGVARLLGVPLIHGWKKRDVSSGHLTGFGLEPTTLSPGSLVLVVDDICDGGGTFLGLADVLDAAGLRAHLYVTHGLFTKGTEQLLKRYHGHVYCTDSTVNDRPGVIEIPICERLLRGKL